MRWLLLAALATFTAAPAHAGVRAVALPSRQGGDQLTEIAGSVADELSRRLGLGRVVDEPLAELRHGLERNRRLAAMGALEEASRGLEASVAAALDALHRLPEGSPILGAQVDLAAIAIAADQRARADAIFDRILVLDPGFELSPDKRSPRMAEAFAAARRRAEDVPPLVVGVLGRACADGAHVVVVARGMPDGSVELYRFDDCRLYARTRTTGNAAAADLAAALDPGLQGGPGDKSFYKSGWFWAGSGAAALVGGVALYFLVRDEPRLRVTPVL